MYFLLPLLFALAFARHQYDPGFPASASYPQNFTGPVSLRYGSAYGVLNVYGTFAFNYNVMNQPGRNAKFQVLVFDRRNFYIYQNDTFAPQCLNAQTCKIENTLPRSGQVTRVNSQYDDIWLVVRNRNLVDNANLQVSFAAFRTGK